jgi:hypothetical protein
MSSIQEAAKKMKENVSLLVVVDGSGKSQGLVTERDLVRNDALMIYILVRWQVIVFFLLIVKPSYNIKDDVLV